MIAMIFKFKNPSMKTKTNLFIIHLSMITHLFIMRPCVIALKCGPLYDII